MTDPYRITPPPASTETPLDEAHDGTRGSRTDTLLWTLFALGLVGNAVASATGQSVLGVPFGVAVLVSAVALAKRHLGRRS